jgi:Ca2+-binding EF-hand superfamily protein
LIAAALLAGPAQAVETTDLSKLFERLDQNHDGQLEVAEVPPDEGRMLLRLIRVGDSDKNGRLSEAEFRQGVGAPAAEKPLVEKQPSSVPGGNELLLVLGLMNTNGDRRIDRGEAPESLRGFFDQAERAAGGDPDGVLEQRELVESGPRLARQALRLVEVRGWDVEAELALLPEPQWRYVQSLSGSRERPSGSAPTVDAAMLISRLDADGDGMLSRGELPRRQRQRFARLDSNGDGRLDRDEMSAVEELLRRNRRPEN